MGSRFAYRLWIGRGAVSAAFLLGCLGLLASPSILSTPFAMLGRYRYAIYLMTLDFGFWTAISLDPISCFSFRVSGRYSGWGYRMLGVVDALYDTLIPVVLFYEMDGG
ncbi:hypothetical protein BJ875DRAFT_286842 [Amylocarpus encephaloides]|uniref:Uncharacterized protein n=1 Tax=Amylocarpus encephaloides TaxID=45428 RepID=A0A9P8C9X5_9HELO|nr:hypothetical protein BJ875DRAFT_286842 [Amylocarpus encephaloides]